MIYKVDFYNEWIYNKSYFWAVCTQKVVGCKYFFKYQGDKKLQTDFSSLEVILKFFLGSTCSNLGMFNCLYVMSYAII